MDVEIHKRYGIHYNDPRTVWLSEYRVDLCVSVEKEVTENVSGILDKVIPALRCANVWYYGSRENIAAAQYLYEIGLSKNKERLAECPTLFHDINVGPHAQESDMVTDISSYSSLDETQSD